MPSNSYINFLHIRIDVLKLIETHTFYTNNRPGRKNLGFLTRSAVVMLCAAWERYNEDLLLESIDNICGTINEIGLLNDGIKNTLSQKVKSDRHNNKPIELAGLGWKDVWKNYALDETKLLNTPKGGQLRELFLTYLGIPDYTRLWTVNNSTEIDRFVSDRGNIAHNGNKASYIRMTKLREYQDLVINNVINIDSTMADEIQRMTGSANLPWTKDYYTDLSQY
jgi:hypothetical protein